MDRDTAFQMSASNIRFGKGCTSEIGLDLAERCVRRTLVIIDPHLVDLPSGQKVIASLKSQHIEYDVFSDIRIEPTDASFQLAIDAATDGEFDAILAVGGGSTAKAANLYSTYPTDFLYYVNAPIGQGQPVPGPLKPLIAVPTTAGTGSETTGVDL